jgi:hypothetical protein
MSIFNSSIISAIRRQLVVSLAIATFAVVSPSAKAAVNVAKGQLELIAVSLSKTPSAITFKSNTSPTAKSYRSSQLPDFFSNEKISHGGWINSIRLNLAKNNIQSAQLSPKIRFESKAQRIEITERAHSVSI